MLYLLLVNIFVVSWCCHHVRWYGIKDGNFGSASSLVKKLWREKNCDADANVVARTCSEGKLVFT